ncbi:hypothetical protein MKZ38_001250 [Zalerion maritima]|uniref:Uncharacterized protein n=1 Tax=Zalerion maritima TaxID=339359 RepID=A0AAD5WML0_9PEZI|nr:hypothetical protein MKZ38_001250 [Zalerion maritima]
MDDSGGNYDDAKDDLGDPGSVAFGFWEMYVGSLSVRMLSELILLHKDTLEDLKCLFLWQGLGGVWDNTKEKSEGYLRYCVRLRVLWVDRLDVVAMRNVVLREAKDMLPSNLEVFMPELDGLVLDFPLWIVGDRNRLRAEAPTVIDHKGMASNTLQSH